MPTRAHRQHLLAPRPASRILQPLCQARRTRKVAEIAEDSAARGRISERNGSTGVRKRTVAGALLTRGRSPQRLSFVDFPIWDCRISFQHKPALPAGIAFAFRATIFIRRE
jgi:hypothetical protein